MEKTLFDSIPILYIRENTPMEKNITNNIFEPEDRQSIYFPILADIDGRIRLSLIHEHGLSSTNR